jgi:uncharacterized protein (TIGR02588 family)
MIASGGNRAGPANAETPLLEWVAAALGLLLTLALLGVIGWEAMKGSGEQPPAVEATVEEVVPVAGGFVVEVTLRNHSPSTAAAVAFGGRLRSGGTTVESSSATVDYVPGESTRHAGLFFAEDPRRFTLEVRALGYAEP